MRYLLLWLSAAPDASLTRAQRISAMPRPSPSGPSGEEARPGGWPESGSSRSISLASCSRDGRVLYGLAPEMTESTLHAKCMLGKCCALCYRPEVPQAKPAEEAAGEAEEAESAEEAKSTVTVAARRARPLPSHAPEFEPEPTVALEAEREEMGLIRKLIRNAPEVPQAPQVPLLPASWPPIVPKAP